MPYSNVPEEKWGDMDSCVEKVMADGKTKEQAIAICYSSIVERKDIEEETEALPVEEKEDQIAEDAPVGLAAELGTEEAPVDQEIMDEDIEGEPEQEITEGVEGPPADDVSGIVKVEFIDDGDDFEMDAAIAGIGGESPYPDMRGQEPPPYEPPGSRPPTEEGQGGTPVGRSEWTPPDMSIQELMASEPAAMFYNGSVPEVVESERQIRSFRNRANRIQRIADLRPKKNEPVVERVKGLFRRLIKRHHGPGSHPGTGTPQEVHAGGRGGVAERPKHVGASIKIKQLSNPRTTAHINDADYDVWDRIESEQDDWGTDPWTGEMKEDGAWSIANSVIDNAKAALQISERMGGASPGDRVQSTIQSLISGDIENDHYEVERTLKTLYEKVEKEMLGAEPSWVDIAEFIEKSPDEMLHMSDSDIEDAIGAKLGVELINRIEADTEDKELESWAKNFIRGDDSYDELREVAEELEGGLYDHLNRRAHDAISDYHSDNPLDYDYDYLIDELGMEPEDLGFPVEGEEGEVDFEAGPRSYYYSTDNETGEVVSVMQTTRSTHEISQSRLEEAAERFGIDPEDVSRNLLVIDLLASKYPRQGYGTEMILSALKQAHEEDRGLGGTAVMAAAMFYDKLGAQYLSELGQTEGGTAFWTNVQVHAAYEWLQGQMAGIESGEITSAEIGEEQAQAETREPSARGETPSASPSSTPQSLREMVGTEWLTEEGGRATIEYQSDYDSWVLNADDGYEIFNNDGVDADMFFSRLYREGYTPADPAIPSASHIGTALMSGELSPDIDERIPTVAEQFQTTPGGVSLVNFGGGEQSRNMGIQNQAAANSRYLSFDHESGVGVPVIAMQVDRGGRTGPTVWEVIGSGQIYDNEDDLLEDTGNWGFVTSGAGPVGSDTMGMILEQMSGDEDIAQGFLYNMLLQSNRAEELGAQRRERELAEVSLRRGPFRRVERHYGPGDHPGTGTPQDVHGNGGGGKTAVGVTSARPGKESGRVFEEMRSFAGELNQIPTIKNVSVTPGLGGWQGGRESTWVVSYEGNGDAMRLIARTAKLHEQEGVLFTRPGGDEPVSSFAFSDRVTPNERDEVENLLSEAGIGGWQWFRLPSGNPTLRIVNVPQYGGDAESHRQSMKKLTQMFDAIEMPHEFNEVVKKVDILEAEGSYGYDTILEE